MPRRPSLPRAAGFSLMELMLVLVLLGLAAAVTIPYLGNMGGAGLTGAARELAAGMKLARSRAVVAATETVLFIDLNSRTFAVSGDSQARELPENLSIELETAQSELADEGGGYRFFPDGSSTGGSVLLGLNERTMRVNVDWLTGRVYITE